MYGNESEEGRAMKVLFVITLMVVLTGCVSVKYSPIQVDSPVPAINVSICATNAPEDIFVLMEGNSCMFPIRADQKLTLTPLAVREKETYYVTVLRNQVWYDASRRNVPPEGEQGSWIMKFAEKWKKHSQSLWFALIAANVNKSGSEQYATQDVSKSPTLKIMRPGRLAFYPNDAIVPILGNFYSNNRGQIWVRIERCATVCELGVPADSN